MPEKYKYHPSRFIAAALVAGLMLLAQSALAKSSFSGEKLKKACMDYIYKTAGEKSEIAIAQRISDQEFEEDGITAKCTGSASSLRGNTHVAIEFTKDGQLIKRLEVPVRIRIYRNVPVLKRSIAKGSAINEDDIGNSDMDVTYIAEEDIPEMEEIIGSRAKRSISGGSVITRSMIESGVSIHSGDKVELIVQSGAVRIKTKGTALQDATAGKRIRVKREGTRDILYGIVATDGSIIISSYTR